MNIINKLSKGLNLKPISNALYVLSQLANQRKKTIASLHSLMDSNTLTDAERSKMEHQAQQLSKIQQYFHAERLEVIRYLMPNKEVNVKGYVASGGYNYGVVQIGKYQFYSILNNRIIAKLNLEQIGTELEQFEILTVDQLEQIMPIDVAEKTFKLFLAKIRLDKAKPKKQHKKPQASKSDQDEILSKSISEKGNIMVIKKRKFSDVVKANKANSF